MQAGAAAEPASGSPAAPSRAYRTGRRGLRARFTPTFQESGGGSAGKKQKSYRLAACPLTNQVDTPGGEGGPEEDHFSLRASQLESHLLTERRFVRFSVKARAMGRPAATGTQRAGSFFSLREERARVHGVDCADAVEWSGWQLGKPSQKTFIIRNVSTKNTVVKFKLPHSKYFQTDYPEPLKLVPGMTARVNITFKANREEEYQDELEFETPAGSFKIALVASRPATRVEVRTSLGGVDLPKSALWATALVLNCVL